MRCPFPSHSRGHGDESLGWVGVLVVWGWSLPSPQPHGGAVTLARPSRCGSCWQKCCFPCAQKAPCDGAAVFVLSVHVAVVTTSSLCFPSTGHVHGSHGWSRATRLGAAGSGTASSPVLPGSTGLSRPNPSLCLGFASHAEPCAAPAMMLGVSI